MICHVASDIIKSFKSHMETHRKRKHPVACHKMVSFVCDGCGDVVKKPKLQQHYNRCFSPVTCLDCSTQFGSPKEAHSSCMTEDEKYQKSYV